MPFEFEKLSIPEVVLIKSKVFLDERGFFKEIYKFSESQKFGITKNFVQTNVSKSKKNVLRGLHYQLPPYEQAKLVCCIKGKILDVAVDIRKNSPAFKKWVSVELSEENHYMLYVPEGFAHGFLVLEEAIVLYHTTKEYSPQHDRGIIYNDPEINVQWPVDSPILSQKDKSLPLLKDAEL